MYKRIFVLLMLGWLVTACAAGKPASSATQPAVPGIPVVLEPTATTSPFPTASAVVPTRTSAPTSEALIPDSEAMPGCTAKSLFPTPNPTTQALLPPVSNTDWVRGPETASVTLIEYSDFQ